MKQKNGVARLLEIAGSKSRLLIISAVLAVIHALLALVPYVIMLYIISSLVTPPVDIALLKTYLIWAVVAAIVSYVALYFSGLASHVAAYNILYALRKSMARQLGALPLGFINSRNSGVLKKIISDDIERIEGFIAHHIPDFVKGIIVPVLTIGYLFYMDWRLALVSFVPLLVLAIWMPLLFSSASNRALMKKYHVSLESMNSAIIEFVKAMPVMKIFGQTASSFKNYSGTVNDFNVMVHAYQKKHGPPFAVFMSFISNALLPVLALGVWLYFRNGITLPVLLMFLILGVGYLKPVLAFAGLGSQLSLINMGVKRLDEVLYAPATEGGVGGYDIADYTIEFKDVSFSYEEREVLSDVSFKVPQGSIVALVGPSGAGKSTAAQLIARFWDVNSGMVKIGGVDIKQIPSPELMELVAFVFQDNFMFQETIYENIRMGMDRTEEEVVAAAKVAQCHHFITALPRGYHTKFGEAGVHLSGGEQQRIQLARAILKNAPILILDEATAFSDPENEYLIQQAFSQLIRDKTVIIIAHRLSTITDADNILVFDKGRVEASGRHEELLDTSSLYQQMWNAHTRAKQFSI